MNLWNGGEDGLVGAGVGGSDMSGGVCEQLGCESWWDIILLMV